MIPKLIEGEINLDEIDRMETTGIIRFMELAQIAIDYLCQFRENTNSQFESYIKKFKELQVKVNFLYYHNF